MINELDKTKYTKIKIAGVEYSLRFNVNSFRYIEEYFGDINEFLNRELLNSNIDTALHMLRAGMMNAPENIEHNEEFISKREFDKVVPSLARLGDIITYEDLPLIAVQLVSAMAGSISSGIVDSQKKTATVQE